MKTVIRLGASALVVLMSMAWPRAAFADCGGGSAALEKLMRARPFDHTDRSEPARPHESTPWDGRDADRRASIVGLWQVTFTVDDVVTDVGFDAWHADGTETLNDAAPISHNICLGVWQQTGRGAYQLKHPAFRYDAAGNLIGTLILRETNVVDRSGNRFSGDFTIQFFDLAGALLLEAGGRITGERVTVE